MLKNSNRQGKQKMATKKQKQELLEVLKFTPQTLKIEIGAYGGECYIGTVDRKIYDYFKEHKIDLDQYASDWDNELNVPEEFQPFPPGSAYECDNLCHASGAEMTDSNTVTVTDEKGNTVWEGNLSLDWLDEQGIAADEWESTLIEDQPEGTVVFWGGQGEKGLLFGGEFEIKQPFDPLKLKFQFCNADGWYICNGVQYNDEDIDNNDYSTTGKWGENKWVIVGDEEVYESVYRDVESDNEEDEFEVELEENNEDWNPAEELDKITEAAMTDWYPVTVKPERKGEYEVDLGKDVAWPFSRIIRAEWSGRTWKNEDGKSVKGIIAWRGWIFDPNELET
jgi:hypothetical protein